MGGQVPALKKLLIDSTLIGLVVGRIIKVIDIMYTDMETMKISNKRTLQPLSEIDL
jgi:hypothetical protein